MKTAAIPSSLRKINRQLILRHMVQVPQAARGELATVAGTSCVTAGKIVDELLEQGVLEPAEMKRASRPGRPGQTLRLNTRAARLVLVQLGVRHTRMAYAPLGTAVDTPWAVEMETLGSAKEWEGAVHAAWDQLISRRGGDVWGVLLCVPGIVDETQGKVLFSPNVHWSEGVDFRAMFRGLTNVPVELVQEIRSLALGQLAASATQKDFLLVDFGHGVGGAAVIGGGLYTGSLPLVCELGHTPVLDNARACGCGAVGCMETLLSRRGLFTSVQEAAGKTLAGVKYAWNLVEQHIQKHELEPWLRRSLQAAAAIIAEAMNVLGVGRVVITGTFSMLPEAVREYLAAEIRRGAMWGKFGEVSIEYAERQRMRGLISVGIERLIVSHER
jgi:predicted NBD/HSP70 family sugar kinase